MFRKLLLDHKKLKSSFKQLQEEMKNKENAHNAALQKEKTEVARLQQELERVQNEKSEMERALKQREEDVLKHKELLDQTEARATSAQQELDALKAKCNRWLAELTRINHEMDSKFLLSFLLISFVSTDISHMLAYELTR